MKSWFGLVVSRFWVVFWLSHALDVILMVAATAGPSARSTIGMEAHGHNDLREWPAGLVKGWRLVKVDFNYQTNEFCQRQKSFRHQPHRFSSQEGCFVLEHTIDSFRSDYNTSDDLIYFLQDPRYGRSLTRPDRPFYIQACLKNRPDSLCENSTFANAWIAAFDDFFMKVQKVVQSFKLSVEVLINSLEATDQSCDVIQKWRPWVSTWDGNLTQAVSDDPTHGNDRFQVFNLDTDSDLWPDLLNHSFYKFQHGSYPLIVYEPSNQQGIEHMADIYLNSGVVHEPGFRFAFNGDPIMFELYAASRTGRARHFGFGQPGRAYPSFVVINAFVSKPSRRIVAVSYGNEKGDGLYHVLEGGPPNQPTRLLREAPLPVLPGFGRIVSLTNVHHCPLVVALDNQAQMILYGFDELSNTLRVWSQRVVRLGFWANSKPRVMAVSAVTFAQAPTPGKNRNFILPGCLPSHLVIAYASNEKVGNRSCGLQVQFVRLEWNGHQKTPLVHPTRPEDRHCITYLRGELITNISIAAVMGGDSARSLRHDIKSTSRAPILDSSFMEILVVYANGEQNHTFAAFLRLAFPTDVRPQTTGPTSSALPLILPAPSAEPPILVLGSSPSVSMIRHPDTGQTMVLITVGNSFCWTSFVRNDDLGPFDGTKICDFFIPPFIYHEPGPGVLSYLYGTLEVLLARIQRFSLRRAQGSGGGPLMIASACDAQLLHGAYDRGSFPVGLLFLDLAASERGTRRAQTARVYAITTHVSWSGDDGDCILNDCDCGVPVPGNGSLVLDSWWFPDELLTRSDFVSSNVQPLRKEITGKDI